MKGLGFESSIEIELRETKSPRAKFKWMHGETCRYGENGRRGIRSKIRERSECLRLERLCKISLKWTLYSTVCAFLKGKWMAPFCGSVYTS